MSARRQIAAASWVFEWTIVTVQSAASSSAAVGRPTICERPSTTASAPDRSWRTLRNSSMHALRRAWDETRFAAPQQSDIDRMKTVHVLRGIERADNPARVEPRRQRQLHQDAVNPVVGIERGDQFQQRGHFAIRGHAVLERGNPGLAAGARLAAYIDLARRDRPRPGLRPSRARRRGVHANGPRPRQPLRATRRPRPCRLSAAPPASLCRAHCVASRR